jgi:hypothetical protein
VTLAHGAVYAAEYDLRVALEGMRRGRTADLFHRHHQEQGRVWLYEDGDRIVGMLLLMRRDEGAELPYFLGPLNYPDLGLGRGLMNRYAAALRDFWHGYSYLWTANKLVAAASLYTRRGFLLVGTRPSTRFGTTLVEQKYEWTV